MQFVLINFGGWVLFGIVCGKVFLNKRKSTIFHSHKNKDDIITYKHKVNLEMYFPILHKEPYLISRDILLQADRKHLSYITTTTGSDGISQTQEWGRGHELNYR